MEKHLETAQRLRELAQNLYWIWHPEVVEIFRDLDPLLWRQANHNPMAFLARLPEETLRKRAPELTLEARINHAFHGLKNYLRGQDTWGDIHAGPLRAQPVIYLSAEFGLHESLPIYSGGLGVLAGDHLKAASDLDLPLVGVGLFYAKGYFSQWLDSSGWQREHYAASDVNQLPLHRALDGSGQPLVVQVTTNPSNLRVAVWSALVGRCQLVLLDTNVEGNSEEDRLLTTQLYGGDQRMRIRQELVLGVGGLRAVAAMGIRPGVIHLNEGHSAFAILELARQLMERDGRTFEGVREHAAAMTVFTTHTPVEAGHDRFEPALLMETLGALALEMKIPEADLLGLGRLDPKEATERFCMTVLGLKMSRHRNGVSCLHGRVSRSMWKSLWPGKEPQEVPIDHITNGIHVASWLALPMSRLLDRALGPGWQDRMDDPETWRAIDDLDDVEFWEQRQTLKDLLIEFVRRRVREQERIRQEPNPICSEANPCLDPKRITIGFARRFASYKRADLLLSDLDQLDRLVNHPQHPVQIIYAGKAHPADDQGKSIIRSVYSVTRDPRFSGKVVFIEDHDINVGRHLVQGVDVWLNTPRRPMEASGTSGQKVILNGGLNLSVLDGWWAECYDGFNGFSVGAGAEHVDTARQDQCDREALLQTLQQQVLPLYYRRDPDGIPRGWTAMQKHAIRTLAWRTNARRMVINYALGCYLPAVGGLTSSFAARGG